MHHPAAKSRAVLAVLSPRGSRNTSLSCVSLAVVSQWPPESIISDRWQTQTTDEISGIAVTSSIASPTCKHRVYLLFYKSNSEKYLKRAAKFGMWIYLKLGILSVCIGTDSINGSRHSNKSIFVQYSVCWCGTVAKQFIPPNLMMFALDKHCDCRLQVHN